MCLAVPHALGVAHVGAEAQPPSSPKKPFPPLLAPCLFFWRRRQYSGPDPLLPPPTSPTITSSSWWWAPSCSLQRDTYFHACVYANIHRYTPPLTNWRCRTASSPVSQPDSFDEMLVLYWTGTWWSGVNDERMKEGKRLIFPGLRRVSRLSRSREFSQKWRERKKEKKERKTRGPKL